MKLRIALLSVALAGTAGWLGACAGQPNAGCPVINANPLLAVPPYWLKYTLVTPTGACGDLKGESIGFQKYNTPGTNEYRLAYRFENLGYPWLVKSRKDPADPKALNTIGYAKITQFPAMDNFCEVSQFTGAATDGGSFAAPFQRFEAIPGKKLADGGTGPSTPELFLKYEWQKLRFLATVNAPGTILDGELKYTEGSCTATFKVFGLWPASNPNSGEFCSPKLNDPARHGYNAACDPMQLTLASYKGLTDAGLFPDGGVPVVTPYGSGINPTFQTADKPVTCGEAVDIDGNHHCELQLTLDEVLKL